MLGDGRKVVFRQGEDDRDRLQLGDDQHGIGVGGMHDISRIDQPQADAATYRSGDMAIEKIQLGVIDGRLIGAHRAI